MNQPRVVVTEEERQRAAIAVAGYYGQHGKRDTATHFRIRPPYVLAAMKRYKRPDGKDICPAADIREILRRCFTGEGNGKKNP